MYGMEFPRTIQEWGVTRGKRVQFEIGYGRCISNCETNTDTRINTEIIMDTDTDIETDSIIDRDADCNTDNITDA